MKNFEVHARKSLHGHEWTFKVSPCESSEKRRAVEKASVFLENYLSYPEQNVGENMDCKAHSDGSQKETRNVLLLDNREKASLILNQQRTWLNCV